PSRLLRLSSHLAPPHPHSFPTRRSSDLFNERARSPKGALGLMQVMPETGAWVARQLSWPEFHPDMLYDPERNLTIGTWYLRHLADRKSTRLNSSHVKISYAVFCLKKKKR